MSSSSTSSDAALTQKIPFAANESDYRLWAAQIPSHLTALDLDYCLTHDRPAAAGVAPAVPAAYVHDGTASANAQLAAQQGYILDMQLYDVQSARHNLEVPTSNVGVVHTQSSSKSRSCSTPRSSFRYCRSSKSTMECSICCLWCCSCCEHHLISLHLTLLNI